MKVNRIALAIICLGAVSLAACGDDDKPKSDDTDTTSDDTSGVTDPADDTETTGDDTETTNDDTGGSGNEECDPDIFPPGLGASVDTEGFCDYLNCVMDEVGVDSAEELQERFGDSENPDPAVVAEIIPAITKCAQEFSPNG